MRMQADEMWRASGIAGTYEAWAFGDAPDKLARLVLAERKKATASAYPVYEATGAPIPQSGEYSVILDTRGSAVCVIQTIKVDIVPFDRVTQDFARKEGEGDLSLAYWRQVHAAFFTKEMESIGKTFDESMPVVCEEFEKVFPCDFD